MSVFCSYLDCYIASSVVVHFESLSKFRMSYVFRFYLSFYGLHSSSMFLILKYYFSFVNCLRGSVPRSEGGHPHI